MPDLPEDILNALNLFEAAFGKTDLQDQARTFKNAVYLTNDCMDDFPVFREDIQTIRYSYTVRLLCSLTSRLPLPDYTGWLEFVLLFCIDFKPEIKRLKHQDTQLFEDFLLFLRLYGQEITPELQTNIAQFLEDINQ